MSGPWVLAEGHRDDPRYHRADDGRRALLDRYHDDGVVVVEGLVDPTTVAAARAATESDHRRRPGRDRVADAWRWRRAVRDLAVHPPVLELVELLLGRDPVPFQTLGFCRGTEQALHADADHFDTLPTGFVVGVWVALEDVGDDQGPLVVHPGSHRQAATGPAVRLPVTAGTAVVWSAGLVHGGAPVDRPGSSRWSQVTHYFGGGCVYTTPLRSPGLPGVHFVRDPLVDLRTGRAVPQPPPGSGLRLVRTSGRLTRVEPADAPVPAPGTRLASAARGVVRRLRWRGAAVTDRVRR